MPTKQNDKKRNVIYPLIALIVFLIFCLIPPFGAMTEFGMKVLGMFIAVIFVWATNTPTWVCVVMAFIMAAISGLSFVDDILLKGVLGNSTLWICLSAFLMMYGLAKTNLVTYIAKKIMGMKFARKSPYALMVVLLIATAVAAAVTQAMVAVLVLMLGMLKQVSADMKLEKYNMWTVMTAISIAIVLCISGLGVPYCSGLVVILGLVSAYGAAVPTIMQCVAMTWIIVIALIIILPLFTKFIIRPKIDKNAMENIDLTSSGLKFTKPMMYGVIVLVVTALIIVLPSFLPKTWALTTFLSQTGFVGAMFIGCILLCFFKDDNGKPMFSFDSGMKEGFNWSVVWYMGVTYYIGGLMTGADVGFVATVSALLAPLRTVSPMVIALIIFGIIVLLTNVLNNFVCVMIAAPLAVQLCSSDPVIMAMTVYILACGMMVAVALPSGSVAGVILHGDSDLIKPKQVIGWGYLLSVLVIIVGDILFALLGRSIF